MGWAARWKPPRSLPARRALLAAGIVAAAGVLAVFKYAGFALQAAADLLHLLGFAFAPPAFSLVLPAGLSFFTFQVIAYLADVYRGQYPRRAQPGALRPVCQLFCPYPVGPHRPGAASCCLSWKSPAPLTPPASGTACF